MNRLDLLQNTKLRTKMILLVSGIVVLCVVPLSIIVYYKNKGIVLEKTYEVCKNIATNIAKIADDELLVGDTYEATTSAITKLKDSNIRALRDTFIIDLDGKIVARLDPKIRDKSVSTENFTYFKSLNSLSSRERKEKEQSVLEFTYPIYIKYKDKNIRVGTAVFEFKAEEIFSPIADLRNSILISSGILFIVAIAIAFWISFSLSHPLQILSEGAREFGTGNFSHRIQLTGSDEIGQLASAFNLMGEKIQDFTQHLEQKVLERTNALNSTLEEVKALKVAQDGDYYLTSLLLEPLSSNNNYSKNVLTEFITEQKKKFSFRNWDSQIGGDICITDTIRLRDKDYTVFLNADAMGKSIQGAGGALALGVVFNAGLIRSRTYSQTKVFPELWLKDRFLDLQNVFLSFDGTMYISVCIGLIDNETGLMYFINAEHPWTVLYRDGKASFLENNVDLCKIGTPGQENRFFIKTFQLLPGDVIITGSDGRDDIIIGYEENIEIINEDGNQFLKRVEEGKGELTEILKRIKEFGTLYDDVSLLKVAFQEHSTQKTNGSLDETILASTLERGNALLQSGNTKEAIQLISKVIKTESPLPSLLHLMGRGYMDSKQWEKAIECYSQILELSPSDNDALFQISKAFSLLGKKTEAADYGERLLLREPKKLENIVHLADIYIELGIHIRARALIERVVQLETSNEHVKNLTAKLVKKKIHLEEDENLFGEVSRKSPEAQLMEATKIGDRLFGLKKYSEALKYYSKALTFNKNNITLHYNIGQIYNILGDPIKANKEWEECLRIDPNFSIASNLETKAKKKKESSKS